MHHAVYLVRKMRLDAEKPDRDGHPGIEMLRGWLRRMHMDLVGGWDQDTSQDDIAALLGEHPRTHARFGMINPEAQGSDAMDLAAMFREAMDAIDEIHVPENVSERMSVAGKKEEASAKLLNLMIALGVPR